MGHAGVPTRQSISCINFLLFGSFQGNLITSLVTWDKRDPR